MLEDRVAKVVLNVEADALPGEPPPIAAHEADRTEGDHHGQPRSERLGPGNQDVVDKHCLHSGADRGEPLPDHGEAEGEDDVRRRHEVRQKSPDRATAAGEERARRGARPPAGSFLVTVSIYGEHTE